jgi:hypothetical protein
MASGSPEHHMDRLGRRLGDRICNSVLAAEERLGTSSNAVRDGTSLDPVSKAHVDRQTIDIANRKCGIQ